MFALNKVVYFGLGELSNGIAAVDEVARWGSNVIEDLRIKVDRMEGCVAWTSNISSNAAVAVVHNNNTSVFVVKDPFDPLALGEPWSFGVGVGDGAFKIANSPASVDGGNVVLTLTGTSNAGTAPLSVGVGTHSPQAKLHVEGDALKVGGGGMWTVVADRRLVESVAPADLERCYSNVRNAPLKTFAWRQEFAMSNANCLGWIAQDVDHIFPASVGKKDMCGYADCCTLNADHVYASMFGALQKMQQIVERHEVMFQAMSTDMESLYKTITAQQSQITELQRIVL